MTSLTQAEQLADAVKDRLAQEQDATRYVRTRGGGFVHRAGCWQLKHAKDAHPWNWANGKTRDEIEA